MTQHAIKRALERYGETLSPDDIDTMRLDVAEGRAMVLRELDGAREVLLRTPRGRVMRAIVTHEAVIVTILPLHGAADPVREASAKSALAMARFEADIADAPLSSAQIAKLRRHT